MFTPPGSPGTGGSLYLTGSTASIIGCTFADNSGAAGLWMDAGTVRSSIIRNTGAPNFGSSVAVSYSLVQPARTGPGNISGDPAFVNPLTNDYRLMLASPCIDAGDSGAFPVMTSSDLAGHPRLTNVCLVPDTGTGPAPIADMGALEASFGADIDGDHMVSVNDVYQFLAAYFASSTTGDFNLTGIISVQDIFDFLGTYFSGCP